MTERYRRVHFTDGGMLAATGVHPTMWVPDPLPERLLVIGDPASLPAITSLLEVAPKLPATIWFETSHDSDHSIWLMVSSRGGCWRCSTGRMPCRPS